MLDNREISIAVWLGITLAWGCSKGEIRKAGCGIVRAALRWKILLCMSMMAIYIALMVLVLHVAGVWGLGQLKATILWALTAALVMVFDVASIPSDETYFRKAMLDGLKISVVLEFIVNLYVFSLPLEFILIPVATLIACMLVIAESTEELRPAHSFLSTIMVILGLALLGHALYRAYIALDALVQMATLVEFLFPVILTLLFLPFLYMLATLVSYENVFIRLQMFVQDSELRRFTKLQLVRSFGLNFRALNRWAKRFVEQRPSTREAVLRSIRNEI